MATSPPGLPSSADPYFNNNWILGAAITMLLGGILPFALLWRTGTHFTRIYDRFIYITSIFIAMLSIDLFVVYLMRITLRASIINHITFNVFLYLGYGASKTTYALLYAGILFWSTRRRNVYVAIMVLWTVIALTLFCASVTVGKVLPFNEAPKRYEFFILHIFIVASNVLTEIGLIIPSLHQCWNLNAGRKTRVRVIFISMLRIIVPFPIVGFSLYSFFQAHRGYTSHNFGIYIFTLCLEFTVSHLMYMISQFSPIVKNAKAKLKSTVRLKHLFHGSESELVPSRSNDGT